MFKYSIEDASSIAAVLGTLESEAESMGASSKIAHLWRDWTDLLGPTAAGQPDRALDLTLEYVTPGRVGLALEVAA